MDKIWNLVLEELRTRMTKPSFETWFSMTEGELVDNTFYVKAPNSFAREWLASHYAYEISEVLTKITGETYELVIVDTNNRSSDTKSVTSEIRKSANDFDKLMNIMEEQNKLIREQQQRIDALEKRVNKLELKY